MKTSIENRLGSVKTLSKLIETNLEPLSLYEGITRQLKLVDSMLLESSEIDSKEELKSIIMLQAALRIECNGRLVVIEASSSNGVNALNQLATNLSLEEGIDTLSSEKNKLVVSISSNNGVIDEDERLKTTTPIEVLRKIQNAFHSQTKDEFSTFLCGVFAFDFIATFENLPEVSQGTNSCPDYVFYLAETLLVIDHKRNIRRLYSNHFSGENEESTYFEVARRFELFESTINALAMNGNISAKSNERGGQINKLGLEINLDDSAYASVVENLKRNIIAGDIFQVVPSRTFSLPCPTPIDSYRQLKKANPSPYMFYMKDRDFILFGASPESALKYSHEDRGVLLYPIAGTRPRGKKTDGEIDLDLDARLEIELKLDQKEVAEHMMLVDLARNDISRISEPGTTHLPKLLSVDRYSQVMHLVSCVKGKLRSDLDALHAYQACMNMGTLTGAPKIKATELIRVTEKNRRGSYGGAVGYLNGNGDMDTCIVIRSAFVKEGKAYIQAGAGVVYDSVPLSEAKETTNKAMAVINAICAANEKSGSEIDRGTN
ncbi:anthranilate synthase component 1 [Aliikangiella sp. G2MR2-5]|uniref:anthranilate synthase component 1 n=1 Tax=Aliikangiella sp. G2MR2-5 TaxID=2788943 RepID=UPI0018AC554F|nr:anthranilate synthase component 1 [Aliikangiella sp. G2MR2-5]